MREIKFQLLTKDTKGTWHKHEDGFYVEGNEVAHHINGIKTDNRPDNIEVLSIREHNRLTFNNRNKNKYGQLE